MTPRQRFLETLLFGKPDRAPLRPGGGRESTQRNWRQQGLPEGVTNIEEYAYREAGGELPWPAPCEGFPVDERMIPLFEEKVLERREDSQIVQDWKGNVCEIGNEYTVEYLRNAMDFVTRRWVKCPVENRDDWEEMKTRYNPDDPSRLPEDAEERGKRLENRDSVLALGFSGPFWQLREWLGFEGLCLLFHDDPEWVREMVSFWEAHLARLLENMFRYVVPDYICISEDMAYKSFPMISPEMTKDFLLPTYIRWGEIMRKAGCPIYSVDSDGYIEDLIPVWMEAGVQVNAPIEIAAGNDLGRMRRRFGRDMAYEGAIDKRAMAKGGDTIVAELDRIEAIIKEGGYIPTCDHAVPADVSWPNFVRYVKLLAEKTGWL
jgi:hypothetical protein